MDDAQAEGSNRRHVDGVRNSTSSAVGQPAGGAGERRAVPDRGEAERRSQRQEAVRVLIKRIFFLKFSLMQERFSLFFELKVRFELKSKEKNSELLKKF